MHIHYILHICVYIYMYDKYIETSSSKGRFFFWEGGGTIYLYLCGYRIWGNGKERRKLLNHDLGNLHLWGAWPIT